MLNSYKNSLKSQINGAFKSFNVIYLVETGFSEHASRAFLINPELGRVRDRIINI